MTRKLLPILEHLPQIRDALNTTNSAVISAPPGAGKTTQVPLALLDESWMQEKSILLLEPRRLAAVSCAGHMADLLSESVGKTVGYRIRMDSRVSPSTRIQVVTEGIFTRMIQDDPELSGVGLVIFDEYHERHLESDLGLALCLDSQEGLRPDLRILVMSATMDTDRISELLNHAPVIVSTGRMYPVETHYLPPSMALKRPEPIDAGCMRAVTRALAETTGDVLIFLPGGREIRTLSRRFENAGLEGVQIMTLLGIQTRAEQAAVFRPAPDGLRKIVIATAIAETSITIPGIRVVIDAGLMRVPRFSLKSGMTRLETIPVSKASADQRRGRAGRTAPGTCYRLWSEFDQKMLKAFSLPEIHCVDLAPMVLELAAWGVTDPGILSWLDPPEENTLNQARDLLKHLGAMDDRGQITPHGRTMVKTGLHPRLAHMVMTGKEKGKHSGYLACRLAAFLMEKDFLRFEPGEFDPDIGLRLEILEAAFEKKTVRSAGFKANMGTVRMILASEKKIARDFKISAAPVRLDMAGSLLAHAYPDRIALKRDNRQRTYLTSAGKGVFLGEVGLLSAHKFIVAVHLDGNEKNARIFLAAAFGLEDLTSDFGAFFFYKDIVYGWNDKDGCIQAEEQVCFGRLTVSRKKLSSLDPDLTVNMILAQIEKKGLSLLPWTKEQTSFLLRARFLYQTGRFELRPDLPDLRDQWLTEHLKDWLGPFLSGITRLSQLEKLDLTAALSCVVSYGQRQFIEQQAPTHIIVPSGSRRPLRYGSDTGTVNTQVLDSPVLEVRLQEMFGLIETPKIAGGTIPVTLHLLSPAGRAVQITRDLTSFWQNTYPEVKKDLMGRYPKHYWPDDPLTAVPTARAKPRRNP